MRRSRVLLGLVLLGLAACSPDTTAPSRAASPWSATSADSTYPIFVRAAAGSPSVANPVVSFWARVDSTRSVTMSYTDGTPLMYFRVPKGALAARPDGTPLTGSDSVLITATLTDTVHLVVDLQPSGLRFSAKHPATLKMYYQHTNPDLDGDGVVTAADSALAASFCLWKQETSSDPWAKLASIVNATADEVEASIFGFTSYGIAY